MKVLVVDPDPTRATSVADALTASGATAAVARSASFALTMLEWNRQDVIISRAQVGDMDGPEFCAIVRADPSMAGLRFVLIANDVPPAQSAQVGIDLVIPDGLIGHAIVTRVTHLMRREAGAAAAPAGPAPAVAPPVTAAPAAMTRPAAPAPPPPVAPPPAPISTAGVPPPVAPPAIAPAEAPASPPAPAAAASSPAAATAKRPAPLSPPLTELESVGANGATRTFQGALGALALEELAQAIATGSKTGRLLLVLGTGGGMIAFDGGRIVHAEVGNSTGETAFQALVAASHRERGGKFCFIPSHPRDLANVPKTITRSVADLLVGAAKAMDEER
jgi:CheY-like chemotaxis protein